jgi:hypothetical protein
MTLGMQLFSRIMNDPNMRLHALALPVSAASCSRMLVGIAFACALTIYQLS